MRIIAGSVRGRRLKAPPGKQTRPTSDRVREALFSILGPPPDDAWVLDLFAGSGALGLEALSRGAQRAVFVEESKVAMQTLRQNIDDLELSKAVQVHQAEALRSLRRLAQGDRAFHWIFIDPPYASTLAEQCLHEIGAASMLASTGTVIVEHDRRSEPGEVFGTLVKTDTRRYGDTCVSLYERNAT